MFSIDNDFDFLLLQMGKQIIINGNTATAIIGYADNKEFDDKKIITKSSIKRGDLIEIGDYKYIVISDTSDKRYDTYYKAIARRCIYNIFFNFAGTIKEFPAIVTSKIFDTEQGKYMQLAEGQIQVTLQDNADTSNIQLQQRFIIMGDAWKVTGIDKAKNGLIILNCEIDVFNDNDDKNNEIADRWQYEQQHIYSISITNGDNASMFINDTLQLNCECKCDNIIIDNPQITYTSNNPAIATVNTTGLITAIAEGNTTITATWQGVSDSINITVSQPQQSHNYSIVLNGSDTIKIGYIENYTAKVFDNGVETSGKSVTFSIRNEDNSTPCYGTLQNITSTSTDISIPFISEYVGKYIILKVVLDEDANIIAEKIIQIKGMF